MSERDDLIRRLVEAASPTGRISYTTGTDLLLDEAIEAGLVEVEDFSNLHATYILTGDAMKSHKARTP